MSFPIDLSAYKPLAIDPATTPELSDEQLAQLKSNIQIARDTIVFYTAIAAVKGLGGHTGGPYDIVPEVLIADAFMKGSDSVVPIYYDEAGHRVAIQYLMSVLNGDMPEEALYHYREADKHMPGHPEKDFTPGVKFSSGRLGHMWPFVNGVAMANPGKSVFMFGSDGSQMEGDDAEAARLAVAQSLNVKLVIDDNDVTIAGFPSEYCPGYDVTKTLEGHGLTTNSGEGEDIAGLYKRMQQAVTTDGPIALINKRKMCVGIEGLEGSNHGHDVISPGVAVTYLKARGLDAAADYLEGDIEKSKLSYEYKGSEGAGKTRDLFGKLVNEILDGMSPEDRVAKVKVVDSDLEGSCGLHHIRKSHPEVFVSSAIMERGNFSAAAGFGYEDGKVGIFGTFSAFLEMIVSEATMARLNHANVICHFSHAGVDDMADNTCHFGINNWYADNGLEEHDTNRLYFPADANQMKAVLNKIFWDKGLRYVFSTRSAVPNILDADGKEFFGEGYEFTPGKDEVIREGSAGYIVTYGECLYRALDAVERLKEAGIDVGLINKTTLNVVDEDMMAKVGAAPFILVVESQNRKTGLGSRYGTWLLERGLSPKYAYLGTTKEGCGGLWQQFYHQGLDPESIQAKVKALV